jgi:CBS domain-containing protein
VTHHALRESLVARRSLEPLLVAEDLAEPVQPLRVDQSLRDALRVMNAGGHEVVPVVDGDGTMSLVGVISRAAVLEAYERHLSHKV